MYNNTFEVHLFQCNIYNINILLNINTLLARCCNLNNNSISYLKYIRICDLSSKLETTPEC